MSPIDAIGNAVCRVSNGVGYVLAITFGTVSNIVPEEIDLKPDNKELESMVAEAAYYRAGQRGFAAGYDLCDWMESEKEILARFKEVAGRILDDDAMEAEGNIQKHVGKIRAGVADVKEEITKDIGKHR